MVRQHEMYAQNISSSRCFIQIYSFSICQFPGTEPPPIVQFEHHTDCAEIFENNDPQCKWIEQNSWDYYMSGVFDPSGGGGMHNNWVEVISK